MSKPNAGGFWSFFKKKKSHVQIVCDDDVVTKGAWQLQRVQLDCKTLTPISGAEVLYSTTARSARSLLPRHMDWDGDWQDADQTTCWQISLAINGGATIVHSKVVKVNDDDVSLCTKNNNKDDKNDNKGKK